MTLPPETFAPTPVYVFLTLTAILGAAGDILIFHWAGHHASGWWLAAGLGLWVISLVLMAYLFRDYRLPFGFVVVVLILMHLLIDLAWDTLVLHSRMTSREWLGVALAVGAIVLLQLGK